MTPAQNSSEFVKIPVKRKRVTATISRYIKLGPGGAWEASSLGAGRIDWGMPTNPHSAANTADWVAARQFYIDCGTAPGAATGFTRELREFYTLDPDCLWITFARGHLWWAFAARTVILTSGDAKREGEAYRKTIGGWRNTDAAGRPLTTDSLSTRLTQLAAYRGTICSVREHDYLVRRINGEEEPLVTTARSARDALVDATRDLVRHLHWADFELLVELLLTRGGWRRVSVLGGHMKDIDLVVEQPLTGERASVQVKSAADQATFDRCVAAFSESRTASRFFFACHSPRGTLLAPVAEWGAVHLWGQAELAAAAVDAGLVGWLMDRAG